MSREGVMTRLGTVMSIEDSKVQMVEWSTLAPYLVPLSAPGGVLPVVGDQWFCSREYGSWALSQCYVPRQTQYHPHTTFREVLRAIGERGIADPSFPDSPTPEAPHLAYVGEVRWFGFVPDPRFWVRANGSILDRVKFRELAFVLDPNGVGPTFTIPTVANAAATVLPYFCAR